MYLIHETKQHRWHHHILVFAVVAGLIIGAWSTSGEETVAGLTRFIPVTVCIAVFLSICGSVVTRETDKDEMHSQNSLGEKHTPEEL